MGKPHVLVHRSLATCVVAGLAVAMSLSGAPAMAEDTGPGGLPSWAAVEKAKGDAAAVAVQISSITQSLDALERESGSLGDAAVLAGAEYATLQAQLDTVSADVARLDAQAQRAAAKAELYKAEAVAVAVQSYKNGGAGFGIFDAIVDLESATSLNGADLMQKIGEHSGARAAMATESQAAAKHLQKTREAARSAYQDLAGQAAAARDGAVAAHSAVSTNIQAQQGQSDTLMAQLAFLNNTSVEKEREFRQAQAAAEDYAQAQEAKRLADEAARRSAAEKASQTLPEPVPGVLPVPVPQPAPVQKPVPAPQPVPVPEPQPEPIPVPVPQPPAPSTPGGSGSLTPQIPGGAVNDPAGAQAYASASLGNFGWGQDQFPCLLQLWEKESNWRTNATNPSSGAYGIAQSLPASKYEQAGADWLTNYRTQVRWGLGYIQGRYGSPCKAWKHSQDVGWY